MLLRCAVSLYKRQYSASLTLPTSATNIDDHMGVFRGGPGGHAPQSSIEWIYYGKSRHGWDCALHQKCSVDLKYAKNALAAGARTHWGSSSPPDALVGWGGGHPLPNPHPRRLDSRAFGAQLWCPPMQNPGYAPG